MVRKLEKARCQQTRNDNLELIDELQTLWVLYIVLQRSAILGRFFSSPTLIPAQARVLELPSAFYDILKTYYDEEFAKQIQNYFNNRINIESNIMNAMITGDQNLVDAYTQEHIRNSDAVAELLGKYHYWDEDQWKAYLYKGLQLYFDEIIALQLKDYSKELVIFEQVLRNARAMGRYMASGIVASIRE